MPYLPQLQSGAKTQVMTQTFGGYNHNLRIKDGEMYDQQNMGSDDYPVLSPRKPRGYVAGYTAPSGIHAKEQLAVVEGTHLYYGGKLVEGVTLSDDPAMCPKQMVSMGAYLIIWPDKVYYNTVDPADCGSMAAAWTMTGKATATMCRRDGTDYDDKEIVKADTEPEEPDNGQLWMDTSADTHVLKQYNSGTSEWVQVATVYIKIRSEGIGKQFKEWDGVTISGLHTEDSGIDAQLDKLNTTSVLYGAGDDYIIVVGLIDKAVKLKTGLELKREIPDLDYITESENRLWGCKYGRVGSETVNEIYACKLGDFKNWSVYLGLSTDSYRVSVGSDGPFTGAATLKSYPIFFKEHVIHRVAGSMPSQYQMISTSGRGVQQGSWASIRLVGESLFYKSRSGVMVYDGTVPQSISDALGGVLYYEAVAGAIGDTYYISMCDRLGKWNLFDYDARLGLWHRQDELHVLGFATLGDEVYAIDAESGQLLALRGMDGVQSEKVRWSATFGVLGYEVEEHKYLGRYNIRMQMTPGSKVEMLIQYDSSGKWVSQGVMTGKTTNTFNIPVLPRRCDHCQLKLMGEGQVKIFSIARQMEAGGDRT